MSLPATLLVTAIVALLTAGLAAAQKRYPKARYWYILAIALVFLCLASSTLRDTYVHPDPLGWLLTVALAAFGVALTFVGTRGLYRPALRAHPVVGARALRRSFFLLGLGIGAAIPCAVWVVEAYVVGALGTILPVLRYQSSVIGVVLPVLIVCALAWPVFRDHRLDESLAELPAAARREVGLTVAGAIVAAAVVSVFAVRAWNRFWFVLPDPPYDLAIVYWLLRIVPITALILVAGAAACRWRRDTAADHA